MPQTDFFFLIPLFLLGAVCVCTDLKEGKIKNKWIKIGLLWAVFLYFGLFLYNFFYLRKQENEQYLLQMISNGAVSLLVGYFLWKFKLWAAGDAKLFFVFSLLIPLSFYSNHYLNVFPAFVLLINTFILILAFLALEALVINSKKLIKKRRKPELKKENLKFWLLDSAKIYFTYLIFYTLLSKTMAFFNQIFKIERSSPNYIFFFLALFAARRYLSKYLIKNKKLMAGTAIIFGGYLFFLVLTGQKELFLHIFQRALIYMATIGLFSRLMSMHFQNREKFLLKTETFSFSPFLLASVIATLITKDSLLSLLIGLF